MVELATRRLTFEDFQRLRLDGRYELVNGELEKLVSPLPRHGFTAVELSVALVPYLKRHDPAGFWGSEVDIPTLPLHGRRPDFLYYSAQAARMGLDLERDRVLSIPTLVVEIVSQDDPARDLVTKRQEYAEAGIPHYWIIDPSRRSALTLVFEDGGYRQDSEFGENGQLVSSLFPGLSIEMKALFR